MGGGRVEGGETTQQRQTPNGVRLSSAERPKLKRRDEACSHRLLLKILQPRTTPPYHYPRYMRASFEPPGPMSKSSAPTKAGSLSSGCRYSLVVGSMASFSPCSHEPFSTRSRSSPLAISRGREKDTGSYVERTLRWVEAGRRARRRKGSDNRGRRHLGGGWGWPHASLP